MQRFLILFSLLLFAYRISLSAETPSPLIYGVNLITGEPQQEESSTLYYERYRFGENGLPRETLFLEEGDSRIGKVKTIHFSLNRDVKIKLHFLYEPGATHLYDNPFRSWIYRYSKENLIEAIEHYQTDTCGHLTLYRRERFYWQKSHQSPFLTSRALEDSNGQVVLCHSYHYNEQGECIQKTLTGNLSGDCQIPCVIGSNGYPDANGVESYSEVSKDCTPAFNPFSLLLNEGHLRDLNNKQWNEWGQIIASGDEYGNNIHYTYDSFDRPISFQLPALLNAWDHPYHPEVNLVYNVCNQVIQSTDQGGATTFFENNVRGQPIRIVHPDGSEEIYRYFLDGDVKKKVTSDGTSLLYSRDDSGRVMRTEKRSSLGKVLEALDYTYQGDHLLSVNTENKMRCTYSYNAGSTTGCRNESVDGIREIDWSYALKEKLEEEKKPHSMPFKQTRAIQNSLGQFVKQEEEVDQHGIRSLMTYDALYRTESVTKYNQMGDKLSEVHFRYDSQGHKVLEKHHVIINGKLARDFEIRWEYDCGGRILSITENQTKATRYQYNAKGQLEKLSKPNGVILYYSYNENGDLASLEASDHSIVYRYTYDDLQRLIAIHDLKHDLVQKRSYNAFDELIEETQHPNWKLIFDYNQAGQRASLTLPDRSKILYRYTKSLISSIERVDSQNQSLYQHTSLFDKKGNLETHRLAKGLGEVHYRYDDQNQLKSIQSPWWSQKIEKLDSLGRAQEMDTDGHLAHYDYTDDEQLAAEEGSRYTYDSLLNRLSENQQTWEINPLNQLIQTPNNSYVYDANGNLIEKRSSQSKVLYSYDALDRLIRLEYPQKQAFTYLYDSFNRRIAKKKWVYDQNEWKLVSTEHFIYDDLKEIGKLNSDGELVELRILGHGKGAEIGAAIALELNGRLFIPLHDTLGSVCCLLDAEKKEVAESYRYTAFGQEIILNAKGETLHHSKVGNPWRYVSKRTDEETQLIFFGRREYDPSLGRWLTPDPLFFHDSANLYAFNHNDPLNRFDPYGLFSISNFLYNVYNTLCTGFHYLQVSAQQTKMKLNAELNLPLPINNTLENIGKTLVGESTYLLMGPHFEQTRIDSYGNHELSDRVRVTFVNGILNTRTLLRESLQIISESHGGVRVHYVFRPTEGWVWDISRAIMIKGAFFFGYRSLHAHLLAELWRALIEEMGGVEGGGTIIHYGHSLGGSETDRARELLTPEEQQMIRVITLGSATLIRNEGFQSVFNIVSVNDGVSSIILEPLGHVRNFFDSNSNVRFYSYPFSSPYWPCDHLLNGPTYAPILNQLGENFLTEFTPK